MTLAIFLQILAGNIHAFLQRGIAIGRNHRTHFFAAQRINETCADRLDHDGPGALRHTESSHFSNRFSRLTDGITDELYSTFSQEQVDAICEKSAMAVSKMRIPLAKMACEETGYGIVMPEVQDLTLADPEIIKRGGGYGVRLRASAPSIHMIKANIDTEINPIVGSEQQSEDMIRYLMQEFEEDPVKIWSSNLFGKTLYELITEGLHSKLDNMPEDARKKLGETLEKIINEGSGGLICILL